MRTLVAIPVYNEQRYVVSVMDRVLEHAENVLVIDDGSNDTTPCLLPHFPVEVIRHRKNHGYGRSMLDAFRWAAMDGYDWVITIDCDEQHEPEAIPQFLEVARSGAYDVVSGSRYMNEADRADIPPEDRRRINMTITEELNTRFGMNITDAFCGFKAYRVDAVKDLSLDVPGYAFPMQFWIQALAASLRITELPVRLLYNDPTRTFGGPLNDHEVRFKHYREVLEHEIERCKDRLPSGAGAG